MFPLLHRPTFENYYADRLYERNIWFACVCMGVFAIASKHSDDNRVLYTPDTPASTPSSSASQSEDDFDTTWHSAGVKYYYAVMSEPIFSRSTLPLLTVGPIAVLQRKQSQLTPSSLFEVQAVCVRPTSIMHIIEYLTACIRYPYSCPPTSSAVPAGQVAHGSCTRLRFARCRMWVHIARGATRMA